MKSSRLKDELILLLDIQSSVVKGSLVYLGQGAPRIIFTQKIATPYQPHSTSTQLIKVTLSAISQCTGAVMQFLKLNASQLKVSPHINDVHYVLSSPWIVSEAKSLALNFEKDMTISKDYILGLIRKEHDKFIPKDSKGLEVMEQRVFDVRLNGYSLDDWMGKSAHSLEVSFVVSVAGTAMIELFIGAVHDVIGRKHVHFYSSLLLQYLGIRATLPARGTYTLIHVHGELTDVAAIYHHSCSFFGSYPYGANTAVRCIAEATNTDMQAADSLINLFDSASISHSANTSNGAVVASGEDWASRLSKIISAANLPSPMPPYVIMSALSHESFFAAAFQKMYPKSQIELLTPKHLQGQVTFDQPADGQRLTGLYAIAVNHMRQEL